MKDIRDDLSDDLIDLSDNCYCPRCRSIISFYLKLHTFHIKDDKHTHIGMYCKNHHWLKWVPKEQIEDMKNVRDDDRIKRLL